MKVPVATADRPRLDRASWLEAHSAGMMAPGSVVFHAPAAVFQAPGGGENQLVQTGRALGELGVGIRLFSGWTDRLEDARLLHLFGMSREGLELARVARARSVPVVLSPICWVEPKAIAAQAGTGVGRAWQMAKWRLKRITPGWPCWRRDLLEAATAVLPNSRAEGDQLVRLFGADAGRIRVIPNGVQPHFAAADPTLFRSHFVDFDFVLYVGRIEPRKNVHGLIAAVTDLKLPLVVIGEPPPGNEQYAAECRGSGGALVHWLGEMDHEDPRLRSAYAAARVFALPSWFETPGLAALEAGLAGSAIVITPHGCTREYFGARVQYALPDRPAMIRRAITRAWESGPDRSLARHLHANYLWPEVARQTAEVYDDVAGL